MVGYKIVSDEEFNIVQNKCNNCKLTVNDGIIIPIMLKKLSREKYNKLCYSLNRKICDNNIYL